MRWIKAGRSATILSAVMMIYASASDEPLRHSANLQRTLDRRVEQVIEAFAERKLKPDEMAATVVDLKDLAAPAFASHRGGERIYPASVIKLFYLEAAHHWMEDGKIQDTPELRRALRDMIVDSYNEATHYVIDLLTGTTSGPELPPSEMKEWEEKRNAVNRYFQSRGFININANQKPWCEGPYGRERVFVGEKFTNRNALTTDATARLLTEIALGRAVSKKRSAEMLELMARDPFARANDPNNQDDQTHGFTGRALPAGAKLWSKAGWTSATRHDAAYIELANGAKFVLVVFTVNHANEREIIPTLAKGIISDMENEP
jgi:beta-lactamase class A